MADRAGPMLLVKGLHVHHDGVHVLRGIDLRLDRGEVVALLGRAGAGKSTALKAIMGLLVPTGGEIVFKGQHVEGRSAHEIARLGIGYVPAEKRIFARMTVHENLEVGRRLGPPSREAAQWTFDRVYQMFPALDGMKSSFAGEMDDPGKQTLVIARTLMGSPELLLLDQPAEGFSPSVASALVETVAALKRRGMTILLSEHSLAVARTLAERAYVLEKGELRYDGPMETLAADETTRQELLGA